MTLTLPQKKVEEAKTMVAMALREPTMAAKPLKRLLGKLGHVCATEGASLHCSSGEGVCVKTL